MKYDYHKGVRMSDFFNEEETLKIEKKYKKNMVSHEGQKLISDKISQVFKKLQSNENFKMRREFMSFSETAIGYYKHLFHGNRTMGARTAFKLSTLIIDDIGEKELVERLNKTFGIKPLIKNWMIHEK
jgi:hypothetical protein